MGKFSTFGMSASGLGSSTNWRTGRGSTKVKSSWYSGAKVETTWDSKSTPEVSEVSKGGGAVQKGILPEFQSCNKILAEAMTSATPPLTNFPRCLANWAKNRKYGEEEEDEAWVVTEIVQPRSSGYSACNCDSAHRLNTTWAAATGSPSVSMLRQLRKSSALGSESSKTIPGQSRSLIFLSKWISCMTLVNPATGDVPTALLRLSALISELLPTFGYPTTPTVIASFMDNPPCRQ